MVVDGDRQDLFRPILPDDILIQVVLDFGRLAELRGDLLFRLFPVLRDDVVAEIHTLVADVDGGACDQLADLVTAFPTERTPQVPVRLFLFRHVAPTPSFASTARFAQPRAESFFASRRLKFLYSTLRLNRRSLL